MKRKLCAITGCNFPEGECQELCWHPEEQRADIIGQNGNTGEHYMAPSRVHITVVENGRVTFEYASNWATGDGSEQLDRAQRMLGMLVKKKEGK